MRTMIRISPSDMPNLQLKGSRKALGFESEVIGISFVREESV